MNILQKVVTTPIISKYIFNNFAPFKEAGIQIAKFDPKNYHIRVKMPLTRHNRNIVGVHFGGSLYAMVDPFYMTLLMHYLGNKYIVWDKAASIQFLRPGRGTVYADFHLDAQEIQTVKQLTENHAPIHRVYTLSIYDDAGLRIAEVEKTLYIRRKKPKPAQL